VPDRDTPGFWKRRWSRHEALGLNLTMGMVFCLILLGIFAGLGRWVLADGWIVQVDEEVGLQLQAHREQHYIVRQFFLFLTRAGSMDVIIAIGVTIAIGFLWNRRIYLALFWLLALSGGCLLDAGLKLVYLRERPPFRDLAVLETTKSFPSGHAMGSVFTYGLLAFLLGLRLGRRWQRLALYIFSTLLILAIGFSRLYLGAHYLSDVLGGYILGAAWLGACVISFRTVNQV
jgi:undecaprenyl-diphosphatase